MTITTTQMHPFTDLLADAGYSLHDLAALFPPMNDGEFLALKESIRINGQREPALVWEGLILDGAHRVRACVELGIKPKLVDFAGTGEQARARVLDLNLHRRHLTVGQKAVIAAELAQRRIGDNQHTNGGSANLPTQAEAAAQLSVSERSLRMARQVLDHAPDRVAEDLRAGRISLNAALGSVNGAAMSAAEPVKRLRACRQCGEEKAEAYLHDDLCPACRHKNLEASRPADCTTCGKRTDGGLLHEGVCLACRSKPRCDECGAQTLPLYEIETGNLVCKECMEIEPVPIDASMQARLAEIEAESAPDPPHVARSNGQVEWYTPPAIIAAAKATMGEIDLDPASSGRAQEIVQARCYFTVEDDALAEATDWMPAEGNWEGRVFLNPPYGAGLIDAFAERLLCEITQGTVTQAIWLSNNATETACAHDILSAAWIVCFVKGRIRFLNEALSPAQSPLQGQMIAGLGPDLDVEAFVRSFGRFGSLWEGIE